MNSVLAEDMTFRVMQIYFYAVFLAVFSVDTEENVMFVQRFKVRVLSAKETMALVLLDYAFHCVSPHKDFNSAMRFGVSVGMPCSLHS